MSERVIVAENGRERQEGECDGKDRRRPERERGGRDWNAGVPACNAVASAASNLSALRPRLDSTTAARRHRRSDDVAGGDACVPVASAIRAFHREPPKKTNLT
jgi:hypothetical protein